MSEKTPSLDKTLPPPPVPGVIAIATEPDPNELVSIFNKNPPGGDVVHHVYEDVKNGDGAVVSRRPKIEWRAHGRDFSNVPRWVAGLWKRQFPGIIVDGTDVSKGRSSTPATNERVAAVEGENVELKKRLANMEAMIAELQRAPTGDGKS